MILQHCLNLLKWQGGTIHQVNQELKHAALIVHSVCGTTKGIVEYIDANEIQLLVSGGGSKQITDSVITGIQYDVKFHANHNTKDVAEG